MAAASAADEPEQVTMSGHSTASKALTPGKHDWLQQGNPALPVRRGASALHINRGVTGRHS